MANRWLSHVKKTMKLMKRKGTYKKGDGLKKVIMEAKKHWHKVKRGGVEPGSDEEKSGSDTGTGSNGSNGSSDAEGGRRRRRGRKTRRRRHH